MTTNTTDQAETLVHADMRPEAREQLEALARATGRDVADLLSEAAEQYARHEAEEIEKIRQGVERADAGGPFVSHDDAMNYLEAVARGEQPEKPKSFMLKP